MAFPFTPNKQSKSRDFPNIRKKLLRSKTSETASPQGMESELKVLKDKQTQDFIHSVQSNRQ